MNWTDAIGQQFEMRLGQTTFVCYITEAMFSIDRPQMDVVYSGSPEADMFPLPTEYAMDLHIRLYPKHATEELEAGQNGLPNPQRKELP